MDQRQAPEPQDPGVRLSVFDIFKVGIGPSSSHTLGPWRAAQRFTARLMAGGRLGAVTRVRVSLYGSLAKTGRGHGTDTAVLLGLAGADPVRIPVELIVPLTARIRSERSLPLGGTKDISFVPEDDLLFLGGEVLPFHPNALRFQAWGPGGPADEAVYYSIGGGFVVEEGERSPSAAHRLPYPIDRGDDLAAWCARTGLPVSGVVEANERTWRTPGQIRSGLWALWETMRDCAYRGAHQEGILPGGLNVTRRAPGLNRSLLPGGTARDAAGWIAEIRRGAPTFRRVLDWVTCFALAVNEENASFSRVVTAPTNGSAGVIPAVLLYLACFGETFSDEDVFRFLLTAGEVGSIFKKGATLSAAQGGCQAEIGVSSAMAAAGLTECLGGTPAQVLMAAEIAMEHHLGLTCDPIGGLVQVPCIERNTMGAVKAITASQLALGGNPENARVSLDAVVRTMWETALDMDDKYKETAEGGLAVQISVNLAEC